MLGELSLSHDNESMLFDFHIRERTVTVHAKQTLYIVTYVPDQLIHLKCFYSGKFIYKVIQWNNSITSKTVLFDLFYSIVDLEWIFMTKTWKKNYFWLLLHCIIIWRCQTTSVEVTVSNLTRLTHVFFFSNLFCKWVVWR